MVSRKYLICSSILFTLIFLVHLLIVISDWNLVIENFKVPKAISVLAIFVSGFFSYKSFAYWYQK